MGRAQMHPANMLQECICMCALPHLAILQLRHICFLQLQIVEALYFVGVQGGDKDAALLLRRHDGWPSKQWCLLRL